MSKAPLLLLLSLISLFGQPTMAQAPARLVERAALMMERTCLLQEGEVKAQVPQAPGTAEVYKAIDYPRYCSCVGDEARRSLTPEAMATASQEQANQMVEEFRLRCAASSVRGVVSASVCPALMRSIATSRNKNPTEGEISFGCACLGRALSPMSDAELMSEVSRSSANFDDISRLGKLQSAPSRIILEMMTCYESIDVKK